MQSSSGYIVGTAVCSLRKLHSSCGSPDWAAPEAFAWLPRLPNRADKTPGLSMVGPAVTSLGSWVRTTRVHMYGKGGNNSQRDHTHEPDKHTNFGWASSGPVPRPEKGRTTRYKRTTLLPCHPGDT